MTSRFFELDCGDDKTITIEVDEYQEIIFHDLDIEAERAAEELGFEPNRCYLLWWALQSDEDPGSRLIASSRAGAADIVAILLAAGFPAHAWDYAALRVAIEKGHADIVQMLIDADPSISGHFEDPEDVGMEAVMPFKPVDSAASRGHDHILQLLIDSGIYYDIDDLHSALWLAASEGHTDVVYTLLHAGVDPAAHDRSAIRRAYEKGHDKIAEIMAAWIGAKKAGL